MKPWSCAVTLISLLIWEVSHAHPHTANSPRAFLRTDAGFIKPDRLIIDGREHRTSNYLMSTFDIEEFEYIRASDPNAHRALHNASRYAVAGTRGLLAGLGLGLAVALIGQEKVPGAVPIGLASIGFVYFMNCRHMARHYLHNAINTLNGIAPQPLATSWSFGLVAGDRTAGLGLLISIP